MTVWTRYARLLAPYTASMLGVVVLAGVTSALSGGIVRALSDAMAVLASSDGPNVYPLEFHLLRLNPVFPGFAVSAADASAALRTMGAVLAGVVAALVVKGVIGYGHTYLMHRVTFRVMTSLRNGLHRSILGLPLGTIQQQRSGDLMSRTVDDVNVVVQSVHAITGGVRSAATLMVYLALMFLQNWILAAATLLVVPVLAGLIRVIGSRVRSTSLLVQQEQAAVASALQESIFGLKVIKAFGAEAGEQTRFERRTHAVYRLAMKRVRLFAFQSPATEIAMGIGLAGVFAIGAWQAVGGSLGLGELLAHLGLAALMMEPAKSIGNFSALAHQGIASLARVDAIHELPSEKMDGGEPLDGFSGSVEFRNVSFSFGGEPVLQDVSFTAEPGTTVALVGRSGAGKTTILHLLGRFYEPTSGEILFDGVPVPRIRLSSLRSQIAFVLQESVLFAGTVADNIRLAAPDASDEAVREAARRAHALAFIEAMPQGLGTPIGERGVRLSGGEQQRIAIARAFLKNPPLFLLDEATSSLDSESEASIQRSFGELLQGRTAFVVAHRLTTIQNADKILVIQDGRIVQQGTHKELLAQGGAYGSLHRTQFRQESAGG